MENSLAIKHLRQDPVLSCIIDNYTISSPKPSTNLFRDLLEAIVSQQLSNKAAATIFDRFLTISPKDLISQVPCRRNRFQQTGFGKSASSFGRNSNFFSHYSQRYWSLDSRNVPYFFAWSTRHIFPWRPWASCRRCQTLWSG
ncbi:MAG: hypothetical protein UV30_C0009G0020 [Candidatus Collierbacteria bacterium GW2011_GWF1_42_50]|nr:MAG: hypothetical protein UV30_C0009G0020 [Candidatus Collierbacteria bacterium GW2011_GWF1_42_50]